MLNKKRAESAEIIYKFVCEKCDFKCSKKCGYERHILTLKHSKLTDLTYSQNPLTVKEQTQELQCENCNKKYKSRVGLWYHLKKCFKQPEETEEKNINVTNQNDTKELRELVVKLMNENADIKNAMIKENSKLQQQNYELQKQVLDVCKNMKPSIANICNNNNKTFNLHFFLNEQCKDAMNISEFINSVTLSVQDLEKVGSLGYVEGISSIIIKQLGNLDIHKRPMHCSDTKRETLYIKDENKWEKEDQENKKIKNVIKSVEHKNLKMINEWTKEHPNYKESKEKDNDTYLKILMEATGSPGNYEEKGNKIIKKIAKAVAIEKDIGVV